MASETVKVLVMDGDPWVRLRASKGVASPINVILDRWDLVTSLPKTRGLV